MATREELDKRISQLRSTGRTESTSKKLGKLVSQRKEMSGGSSSGGGGFGSPSSPSGNSPSGAFANRISGFFKKQGQEGQAELGGLREKFGLPQLEQTQLGASGQLLQTEEQLEKLPEDVKTESRGFDINEAQTRRILASRQQPLAERASGQARDLARATAALQSAQQGFGTEAQFLADRKAREATGFMQGFQNELNMLLQKMQTDAQMSMAEQNRLQQLAMAESDFERQKELMSMQTDEAIRKDQATKSTSSRTVPFAWRSQAPGGISGSAQKTAQNIFNMDDLVAGLGDIF